MNPPFPPHFLILERKDPRRYCAVSSVRTWTCATSRTRPGGPRSRLFGFRNKTIGALPTTPAMR